MQRKGIDSNGLGTKDEASHYTEIRTLSSGKTKSTILAKDKRTGETVVIKRLERGAQVNEQVLNGLLNHRRLFQAHVADFIKCFVTEKHFCIVTEYAPGGTLMKFLNKHKGIEECVARWLFQQLMIALEYCHKLGIAVGNINLKNIVLDVDNTWPVLKIRDFLSSVSEKQGTTAKPVTAPPLFLAPEIIVANKDYDPKKADIWSCGVLLYTMVYNCYPFITKDDVGRPDSPKRIEQAILEGPLMFRRDKATSPAVRDLLKNILQKDPNKRMTLDQIMKHVWFRHNLPKGALDMNKDIIIEEHGLQTEEEISDLFKEAMVPYNEESQGSVNHEAKVSDNDEDRHINSNASLVSSRA